MRAWEYKVIYACYSNEIEIKLNQFGKLGWELVSVHTKTGTLTPQYIFKREIFNMLVVNNELVVNKE